MRKWRDWSPERLEEARQLYDAGLSFSAVGRRLGYSASYIARRFRAAGVPVRRSGRPLTSPGTVIDVGELVRLRESGETYPELAARYRVSDDVVRTRYLRAKDLPLRRSEAERRGMPFGAAALH